jgi:outer membrane protein OmpA-like peptidoglycan-associated protein
MTRPIGHFALIGAAILGFGGPAAAQKTLSDTQMVETLTSAAKAAPPGLTAAIIQEAVARHMKENPGLSATRARLDLNLEDLAQINVQIQFALNSAIIRPESYATIGSIADALHHPVLSRYRFVVTGNTDATGDRAANLKLSQARAEAVVGALTSTFGVDPSRLEAVGLGEEALLDQAKPDDPINRRVQVINIGR